MIYAIVGSRDYRNYEQFKNTLDQYKDITKIVSGGARGPDGMAERYAKEYNIPTEIFYPDWKTFGMGAGFKRNTEIINASEAVIAFWDGKSKGTKDSLEKAIQLGKIVTIHLTK